MSTSNCNFNDIILKNGIKISKIYVSEMGDKGWHINPTKNFIL